MANNVDTEKVDAVQNEAVGTQKTALQKFNDAVIAKMEENRDPETGRISVVGVDMSSPDVAITQLNFSDVPGLVLVKLEPEPEGKKSIDERVSEIGMIMTFSDTKSIQKLIQWGSLIYDRLYVDGLNNSPIDELV